VFLPWTELGNPILEHPQESLKDPTMAWRDGWFYLFYSVFHHGNQSRLAGVRTRDFRRFEPLLSWGDGPAGWCSPNLQHIGGRWLLTYQSWDGATGADDRHKALFYASSDDLQHWDAHHPLGADLTAGQRAIDPALAQEAGRLYLLWKEWQTPQLAVADSLDGPWQRLGNPFGTWAENGEFLRIDGRWHVVIHARLPEELAMSPKPPGRGFIAPMSGAGREADDWMHWGQFRPLEVPLQQGFNDEGRLNAAFIADWREHDGHFYMIFCARRRGAHGGNMGHAIGIARSADLADWTFPPKFRPPVR
jgi:beta-xylosidase